MTRYDRAAKHAHLAAWHYDDAKAYSREFLSAVAAYAKAEALYRGQPGVDRAVARLKPVDWRTRTDSHPLVKREFAAYTALSCREH